MPQDILLSNLHANDMTMLTHTKPEDREIEFFSDLPKELAVKLYELYEKDFAMFGYDYDLDKYYRTAAHPTIVATNGS